MTTVYDQLLHSSPLQQTNRQTERQTDRQRDKIVAVLDERAKRQKAEVQNHTLKSYAAQMVRREIKEKQNTETAGNGFQLVSAPH